MTSPRARRQVATAVTAASVALFGAAGADAQGVQWLSGTELNLTRQDTELQRRAIQETLDANPDGEKGTWKNPETGHSGEVVPLRSYEREGQRCRVYRLVVHTGTTNQLQLRGCKQPDGSWKIPPA